MDSPEGFEYFPLISCSAFCLLVLFISISFLVLLGVQIFYWAFFTSMFIKNVGLRFSFLGVPSLVLRIHWGCSVARLPRVFCWMLACMLMSNSFVISWTVALQGSSIHGISQARILEWIAIPFSRGFPQPRDWTHVSYVSCIDRWVLYHWVPWEAHAFQNNSLVPELSHYTYQSSEPFLQTLDWDQWRVRLVQSDIPIHSIMHICQWVILSGYVVFNLV